MNKDRLDMSKSLNKEKLKLLNKQDRTKQTDPNT